MLILSTLEATLINKTYSIYTETHIHKVSSTTFDRIRSRCINTFAKRDRAYHPPNRNANLHHVNRTTFYQISPIPTYLNTRWYFAYRASLSSLPPCTTIKQVRTCYIAIRNRPVAYNLYTAVVAPLLLFTTLLRHVGSSQRVVLLEQKIIFVPYGTVARRSRRKKNRKKGGGGHPTVDFPDDFTSWRDFTESCT